MPLRLSSIGSSIIRITPVAAKAPCAPATRGSAKKIALPKSAPLTSCAYAVRLHRGRSARPAPMPKPLPEEILHARSYRELDAHDMRLLSAHIFRGRMRTVALIAHLARVTGKEVYRNGLACIQKKRKIYQFYEHTTYLQAREQLFEEPKDLRVYGGKRLQDELIAIHRELHAKEILLRTHKNVVRKTVDRIYPKIPLDDRIQLGNIGLLRAIERFDPMRGNTLSTYARSWIHANVQHSAEAVSDAAKHSFNVITNFNRVLSADYHLRQKLGREPTLAEIADYCECTVETIDKLQQQFFTPVSLSPSDKAEDDENDVGQVTLGSVGTSWQTPEQMQMRQELREILYEIIDNHLKGREAFIIRSFFGLSMSSQDLSGQHDGESAVEIAGQLGLSRERVRQLKLMAIKFIAQKLARDYPEIDLGMILTAFDKGD
jgi:RNA polymerase nonessential primary-like sigma factor